MMLPTATATTVPTITMELMLVRWAESSNGGASVTFLLADPDELAPFKALTTAKTGKGGQRFMAVLAMLGDDEAPLPVPAPGPPAPCPAPPPPAKGGPLSQLAGRWCSSSAFQEWVRGVYDRHMGGDGSGFGDIGDGQLEPADLARHAILVLCDVDSRAELDHAPGAAKRFHELIRKPFAMHLGLAVQR